MARYCTHCGKEINEEAVMCVHCGCSTKPEREKEPDSDNIGWGFLGFFVPLVGFILWLMWKDEAPKKAKNLGIGALVSVCIVVVGAIGYGIFVGIAWGLAISKSGMAFTVTSAIIEAVRTTFSTLMLS